MVEGAEGGLAGRGSADGTRTEAGTCMKSVCGYGECSLSEKSEEVC